MADVKWIKIVTDIFDDEKIYLIEDLPEADSIIVIWFKLLCLAGKQNNSGVFMLNDKIPYTEKMLSSIFRRKESVVKLALETFKRLEMIELFDNVITIPNWEKHQSLESFEMAREQTRKRVQKHREKQKQIAQNDCNVTVTQDVTLQYENVTQTDKIRLDKIRLDKIRLEEEIREDISSTKVDYHRILNSFNSICISFPKVQKLSDARKKAIKARLNNGYTYDDFDKLFTLTESSSFLKGNNEKKWQATFDWLIKDANIAKVLDGNYNDKGFIEPASTASYDWNKYREKAKNVPKYQRRNETENNN